MKTILVDAVYTFVSEKGEMFKGLYDLLETYSNRKIILTNANDDKFEQYGLNRVPYEVFTLRHNPDKVDPKYFEVMLEHFGLKKDEVLYFEHNLEAVKSAESLGIISYFYDKDKKDLVSLKEFLNKNI